MTAALPLSGYRVLDLTRIISGPYCTAILGDLGAEIIKVETPGEGDPVRHQGVIRDGLSWYFANYNRNKKSVTLNLYSAAGKDILADLIAASDVLVDNYRPGVLEKMGFGPERLKALRPDLVHCGINGFGASGPYRDRPAFDFIAQAMSGFMSLNGAETDPPMRVGPPISDLVAGMNGALGVVAALLRRERTGSGDTLDVSLLGSMIGLLSFHASNYFANGQLPARTGNDHGLVAPYGLFETADGQVAIAPSNDGMYEKFIDALTMPELRAHPHFQTNASRMQHRHELKALVEARTREHNSAYWIARLNQYGVPCGPVLGLREVFEDPQVVDQQMAIDVDHGPHGAVRMLGLPIRFQRAGRPKPAPAPALGADTEAVLQELGKSLPDIQALRAQRVI